LEHWGLVVATDDINYVFTWNKKRNQLRKEQ